MSTIHLDGSKSFSQLGTSLTYLWSISSAPIGSVATLSSTTTSTTSITPDIAGNYIVSLRVNDGVTNSNIVSVTVYCISTLSGLFAGVSLSCENYILPVNSTGTSTLGPATTPYSVPANTIVQNVLLTDSCGGQFIDTVTTSYSQNTLLNQYEVSCVWYNQDYSSGNWGPNYSQTVIGYGATPADAINNSASIVQAAFLVPGIPPIEYSPWPTNPVALYNNPHYVPATNPVSSNPGAFYYSLISNPIPANDAPFIVPGVTVVSSNTTTYTLTTTITHAYSYI